MKSVAKFSTMILACFSLASCTTNISSPPLVPGGNNSNNSSTATSITLGTPAIQAAIAKQGGMTQPVQVLIMTTGSLVNNAAITLSGPSVNLPVTFNYSTSAGTTFIAYYNSSNAWTYQGNQNYTLSISYSGYSGQATVHSVGNVSFTPGGSSLSISWVGGGNYNSLFELQNTSPFNQYSISSGVNSPYTVNQSSLGSYTPGSYNIQLNAEQMDISCWPGAFVGSYFSASDQESTTY